MDGTGFDSPALLGQFVLQLCSGLALGNCLGGSVLFDLDRLPDDSFNLGLQSVDNLLKVLLRGILVHLLPVGHIVEQASKADPSGEDIAHRTRYGLTGVMGILVDDVHDLALSQTVVQLHHGLAHSVDDCLRLQTDGSKVDGTLILRVGVVCESRELGVLTNVRVELRSSGYLLETKRT